MTERIHHDVTGCIGGTPLVRLSAVVPAGAARIVAKLESKNPGGSVKDRICLNMIREAENRGLIKPGGLIVEPTSGNTGIGLALVSAVRAYSLTLVMPDSMSVERRQLLAAYGARVVLTPAKDGMNGSIAQAQKIVAENPGAFMPNQFENPANPAMHRMTTAIEIWESLSGQVDAFVAGVGTGGTITGVGEVLKEKSPSVRVVAVEPAASPVLSGGRPGPHRIQGIGAGFVPRILNRSIIDRIVPVEDQEAYEMSKTLALKEGLHVGISSGAAVAAAIQIARELGADKTVVTILPDSGERYFSMEKYFNV